MNDDEQVFAIGREAKQREVKGTMNLEPTAIVPVGTSLNIAGWSVDQSAALERSSVTKASTGKVGRIFGRIDASEATGTYYLQFFDSATVPGDGAVTFLFTPIRIDHVNGTSDEFGLALTPDCITGTAGISWAISTTEFTKTLVATSKASVTVLFK